MTHTLDVRMYLIVLPRTHAHTHHQIYTHAHTTVYTHIVLYAYTRAHIPLSSHTNIIQFTHIRAYTCTIIINILIIRIYILKYGHKTQIPIPTHTAYTNDSHIHPRTLAYPYTCTNHSLSTHSVRRTLHHTTHYTPHSGKLKSLIIVPHTKHRTPHARSLIHLRKSLTAVHRTTHSTQGN